MKRKSAAPRSFLRQLAEPVPRTAAPLIPRRPVAERGAATRSSIDAIPQIIDVTEAKNTLAAETHASQPAGSIATHVSSRRAKTSTRSRSSQDDTTASEPVVLASPIKQYSAHASAAALQPNTRRPNSKRTEGLPAAKQENAQLHSVLAHSASAQGPSTFSPIPQQTRVKTDRRPSVSVHIGTIEVRIPAPPTRIAQSAPAAHDSRKANSAVPGRASEPLSRSLAWSHGLVQG